MSLTEKLAEYGMTEREDGTLMVPFEDHSGFVQVSVRVGRVWMRDRWRMGGQLLANSGSGEVSIRNWCHGCCSATRPLLTGYGPRGHIDQEGRLKRLAALEVGKPCVPGRTSIEPRVEYSFRRGQHELLLCLSQLSEDEVVAVREGKAEFGLLIYGLVIFLLYRFGEAIAWSDAPYSWHRVPPEQRQLPETPTTAEIRAWLSVALVDADRNVVRALRRGILSPEFTRALRAAIADQAAGSWNPENFDAHLRSAYQSWSTTEQMLSHAIARTSWGA